jgi:threonine aldolase
MNEITTAIADMWVVRGGQLHESAEQNVVWLDLDRAEISDEHFAEIGRKYGVLLDGGRVVLAPQITVEAVRRLGLVFDEVLSKIGTQSVI